MNPPVFLLMPHMNGKMNVKFLYDTHFIIYFLSLLPSIYGSVSHILNAICAIFERIPNKYMAKEGKLHLMMISRFLFCFLLFFLLLFISSRGVSESAIFVCVYEQNKLFCLNIKTLFIGFLLIYIS